ncbi:MAG: hypothetical protein E7A11_18405 [Clostridium sp.]|uniref:hypothetical protein n=1 Tax=Clostridium sp. TaxID=1506 RepID=UPI002903535C|nr:hypothetical protein [Clostridium sp.]MDU1110895.1 hypothetical protein [Staphylococcus epidermidis]MBS7131851.1 hypothetical protein [Clostridium sp.]MDU1127225.1 hypothetical protein [Clostridium sp.]MDU2284207.1 hypothetical protein [Clostridium sp.]MDU3678330.1 hypothetical protein [Clostridium sp.]
MKKYQKLFMVSLVLGMTVIFLGYGTKEVSAKEVSTKEETTEVKNYFKDKRDNTEEFNGKVQTEEKHYKVLPKKGVEITSKSVLSKDDCEIQELSDLEYLMEINGIKTLSTEFDYIKDENHTYRQDSDESGILTVVLEVFRSNYNKTRFQVMQYFTWERIPAFHLNDLVGYFLSSQIHLMPSEGDYKRYSETAFIDLDSDAPAKVVTNTIKPAPAKNGVAAIVKLSDLDAPHDYISGYLQTYVKFADEVNYNITGIITSVYSHYWIRLSDIEFAENGFPSFGWSQEVEDLLIELQLESMKPLTDVPVK